MKKGLIRGLVALGLLGGLLGGLPTTPVQAESSSKNTYNKTYATLKKINRTIGQKLYQKQGDPSKSKAEPNWSKFVKNIKYLKNNQVEIYVTDNFKKLKNVSKQHIIDDAQLFSLRIANNYKDSNPEFYVKGLSIIIFCNGDYIGRSKFMNNKDYIWNK